MPEKEETVRFSVSLPAGLLDALDGRMVNRGYSSRSEVVRDLIREKLVQEKWRDARRGALGVLTICYDHHKRGLTGKIVDAQHRRYVNVLCSTHVHLDHDNCLEIIVIRGRPPEIEKMGLEIGGLKGVKFARLTRTSTVNV